MSTRATKITERTKAASRRGRRPQGASIIDRVLRILEILVVTPEGARVTDIADALDLNRAIPHRLLAELVKLGYVAQDPDTERYRATFEIGSLGLRQIESAGIVRWAQDELDRLASETQELVRLAVVSGSELRWVAKAQGSNSALILDPVAGADVVLHATATGKAWLSSLPDDEARALLRRRGLEMQTPHTETDLERIMREVGAARRAGYAVTHEEMEPGVNAIAVPIVPPEHTDGRAVATVSIAGPSARLSPDVLSGFTPLLRKTGVRLARQWHVYEYLRAMSDASTGRRR